jgi:hypothetical protein
MTASPEDVARLRARLKDLIANTDRRKKLRLNALASLLSKRECQEWLDFANRNAEFVLADCEDPGVWEERVRIVLETLPLSRVLDLAKWSSEPQGLDYWDEEYCSIVRQRMAEAMILYPDLLDRV